MLYEEGIFIKNIYHHKKIIKIKIKLKIKLLNNFQVHNKNTIPKQIIVQG